jgi:hypothetical protein
VEVQVADDRRFGQLLERVAETVAGRLGGETLWQPGRFNDLDKLPNGSSVVVRAIAAPHQGVVWLSRRGVYEPVSTMLDQNGFADAAHAAACWRAIGTLTHAAAQLTVPSKDAPLREFRPAVMPLQAGVLESYVRHVHGDVARDVLSAYPGLADRLTEAVPDLAQDEYRPYSMVVDGFTAGIQRQHPDVRPADFLAHVAGQQTADVVPAIVEQVVAKSGLPAVLADWRERLPGEQYVEMMEGVSRRMEPRSSVPYAFASGDMRDWAPANGHVHHGEHVATELLESIRLDVEHYGRGTGLSAEVPPIVSRLAAEQRSVSAAAGGPAAQHSADQAPATRRKDGPGIGRQGGEARH